MGRVKPMVSVCMITYNHENYIRQAIEGVLMQKVDFDIELLIADDNSPDSTTEIVIDFIRNHKNGKWIKYIKHENNLGMMPNFLWALKECRGKYIAMCEGDDYWKNPHKLMKQVSFLEQNQSFGLVHSDCDFLFMNSNKTKKSVNRCYNIQNDNNNSQENLFDQIIDGSYKIRTATVLFRTELYDSIKKELYVLSRKFLMGDTPLWLLLSQLSKFHYFNEVFAVYRISSNTASRPNNYKDKYHFQLSMIEMRLYFLKKYKRDIPEILKKRYNNSLLLYKTYNKDFVEQYPMFYINNIEFYLYNNIKYKIVKMFIRQIYAQQYTGSVKRSINKFLH